MMSIKNTIIESLSTKITNREEQLNYINLTISLESIGSEVLYTLLKLADALAEDIADLKDKLEDTNLYL